MLVCVCVERKKKDVVLDRCDCVCMKMEETTRLWGTLDMKPCCIQPISPLVPLILLPRAGKETTSHRLRIVVIRWLVVFAFKKKVTFSFYKLRCMRLEGFTDSSYRHRLLTGDVLTNDELYLNLCVWVTETVANTNSFFYSASFHFDGVSIFISSALLSLVSGHLSLPWWYEVIMSLRPRMMVVMERQRK